jgi:hypothetical protein
MIDRPSDEWSQLETAFFELVQLEPATRQARLRQLAADDAALAREVAELLEKDEAPDSALDALLHSSDRATLQDRDHGTDSAAPPSVPGWSLIHPIGRGGMGWVWLAERQTEDFVQLAAVKIVTQHLGSGDREARFLQERRILAKLDHPGIVRLIDGGITENGDPYLVMDAVDGEPIDAWCDAGGVSLAGRLRLMLEVLEAVEVAHRERIVHRDLKPEHILITREGNPRILDFGIAKLLGSEHLSVTMAGAGPGTSGWASPEQRRGGPVSERTDIYALGGILYRLCTGRRPPVDPPLPRADTVVTHAVDEGTREVPARLLAARRGTTVVAWQQMLRAGLADVIARATAADEADRYSSVGEFAAALRECLADPVLAEENAGLTVARGGGPRRMALILRSAALVLLGAVIVVVVVYGAGLGRSQALGTFGNAAVRVEASNRFWEAVAELQAATEIGTDNDGAFDGAWSSAVKAIGELDQATTVVPASGTLPDAPSNDATLANPERHAAADTGAGEVQLPSVNAWRAERAAMCGRLFESAWSAHRPDLASSVADILLAGIPRTQPTTDEGSLDSGSPANLSSSRRFTLNDSERQILQRCAEAAMGDGAYVVALGWFEIIAEDETAPPAERALARLRHAQGRAVLGDLESSLAVLDGLREDEHLAPPIRLEAGVRAAWLRMPSAAPWHIQLRLRELADMRQEQFVSAGSPAALLLAALQARNDVDAAGNYWPAAEQAKQLVDRLPESPGAADVEAAALVLDILIELEQVEAAQSLITRMDERVEDRAMLPDHAHVLWDLAHARYLVATADALQAASLAADAHRRAVACGVPAQAGICLEADLTRAEALAISGNKEQARMALQQALRDLEAAEDRRWEKLALQSRASQVFQLLCDHEAATTLCVQMLEDVLSWEDVPRARILQLTAQVVRQGHVSEEEYRTELERIARRAVAAICAEYDLLTEMAHDATDLNPAAEVPEDKLALRTAYLEKLAILLDAEDRTMLAARLSLPDQFSLCDCLAWEWLGLTELVDEAGGGRLRVLWSGLYSLTKVARASEEGAGAVATRAQQPSEWNEATPQEVSSMAGAALMVGKNYAGSGVPALLDSLAEEFELIGEAERAAAIRQSMAKVPELPEE